MNIYSLANIFDIYFSSLVYLVAINKKKSVSSNDYSTVMNNFKYNVNLKYFENIDSEEKAYWLGFLFADGCNNLNMVRLELQERDEPHLYKLKSAVNYSGPVRKTFHRTPTGNLNTYFCLGINRKEFAFYLDRAGVSPNKTKNPKQPLLQDIFLRHFLRGLFEGDGTLYIKETRKNRIRSCARILIHENILFFY